MSKTIFDYLYELANNSNSNIYDIKAIAFKACYTEYLTDITDILNNSIFKDKIIEEILNTHKKNK